MSTVSPSTSVRRVGAARSAGSARSRADDVGRLTDNIGFLAARLSYAAAKAGHRALEPFDLSIREYTVLELSTVGAGMSQRELGRIMCLDPSNVLRLVDRLAARDLVVRRRDAADRRVTLICATASGRRVAADAGDALEQAHAELVAPLSPAEQDTVLALLRRLALDPES